MQAQWTLDRHFPVAKGSVREDFRLLGLLNCDKRIANLPNMLFAEFAVLLAQVLS